MEYARSWLGGGGETLSTTNLVDLIVMPNTDLGEIYQSAIDVWQEEIHHVITEFFDLLRWSLNFDFIKDKFQIDYRVRKNHFRMRFIVKDKSIKIINCDYLESNHFIHNGDVFTKRDLFFSYVTKIDGGINATINIDPVIKDQLSKVKTWNDLKKIFDVLKEDGKI